MKRCAELAPDDAAVPKLMKRVDAQIERQKAKEKKMYGKTVQGVIRSTFLVDEKGAIAAAQYNVKAAGTATAIQKIIADSY